MSKYYGTSSSSSESDTPLLEKMLSGIPKKKKFPPPTLKRPKRQGMCMCSGDDKSSQESNIVKIESDSDFADIPEEILKQKVHKNLIDFEDDSAFENLLLTIEVDNVTLKPKAKT